MAPPQKNKHKSRLRERKKRRKLGSRAYKNYSKEMLDLACESVSSNQISSRDAERQFGIPRRTIMNKINNVHTNTIGRPTVLTTSEEKSIVRVLQASSEFGLPLTKLDLKLLVHEYLKKNGRDHLFKKKIPGESWVQNFLARHADELSIRITQNISKARSEKGAEEIANYFENLRTTLENIPAENIVNFDETNLSDDPGCSRGIFRRGVKYPERVINSSKGNISLMFTSTASGQMLPLYVVYKASNLYSEWISGGPPNTRYNCTKSGWFDSAMFEDYFEKIIIPWAQDTPGTKVVVCDNLSSHLSVKVVELCDQNDIKLVFIPPRTTHLTQPLDVAFFAPLKKAWRQILYDYKVKNPNQTSINKKHFPKLLCELAEAIKYKEEINIKSGFRASGIFPFNPREVLKKLPEMQEEILSYSVDQALIDYLKETRSPKPMAVKRNKKVNCEPGKSITLSDFNAATIQKNPLANTKNTSGKKTISRENQTKKTKPTRKDQGVMELDEQTGHFKITALNSRFDTPENCSFEEIDDRFEDLIINNTSIEDFIVMNTTEKASDSMTTRNPQSLRMKCINVINLSMILYDRDLRLPTHEHRHLVEATISENTNPSKTDNNISKKSAPVKITIHSNQLIKAESSKSDVALLNSASKMMENTPFMATCEKDLPECLQMTKNDKSKQKRMGNMDNKWMCVNVKDKLQLGCKKTKPKQSHSKLNKKNNQFGEPSNISSHLLPNTDSPKHLPHKKTNKVKEEKADVPKKKMNQNKKVQKNKKVLGKSITRGVPKISKRRSESSSSSTSSNSVSELAIADSDSSDYESLNDCLIAECLRDQEDKENFENNNIISFGMQDIVYFVEDNYKFKENDWLIVRFSTKKSIKHFVGRVLSINKDIPTVKFTRKVKETKCETGTTFTYPKVDDICTISHTEDIMTVLPEPNITRRGQFVFNADFKKFNIQ